jgi:SSS family solute:Na+ symporter
LIQGIIMLAGIVAVIATVLSRNGGFMGALDALARVEDLSVAPGAYTSFFGPDPLNLLGVVLLTSLGTWGLPQMVQKFYAIKSEKTITKGAVISTVFAVVIAGGCYFVGSFGRLYGEAAEINPVTNRIIFDSIIPNIVKGFPELLIGVVILLVLSASMSTLSSLVMASSSTFTLDFLKGNIIKKMTEKVQLLFIRGLVVVFILISTVIAVVQYRGSITFIADLMGIAWGALAGSFLAPFLYGLYWKRANKISVWCCFGFSTILMTLNILFRSTFPPILQSPINAGAFAMLAGLIIVPAVSALTKAPEKETVESCFSCYDETVTVKVVEDLGGDK